MRRIDRIDFTGIGNAGGFSINLGNNGKVGDLQIVWRNLEPYKSCNIATPEQFVRWIKEGVGVISNRESLDLDWKEVKKLNITKLTPYYLGETGDTIQQTVVPFADLEIRAELPTTNLTFHVSCPIVEGKN